MLWRCGGVTFIVQNFKSFYIIRVLDIFYSKRSQFQIKKMCIISSRLWFHPMVSSGQSKNKNRCFESQVWFYCIYDIGYLMKHSDDRSLLEDMLWACVVEFRGNWIKHLPLVEVAYINSYHTSIRMAHYEALYGGPYKSAVC